MAYRLASRVIRMLNQLLDTVPHRNPYAVIMDLSLSVINFKLGPHKKASELNTSNLASHNKTLILSAIMDVLIKVDNNSH